MKKIQYDKSSKLVELLVIEDYGECFNRCPLLIPKYRWEIFLDYTKYHQISKSTIKLDFVS